jgi:hypothetical protein
MNKKLKIGDTIKIVSLPVLHGTPGYCIHKDTVRVFNKIIARGKPVLIDEIDEHGTPWYKVKFKRKNGKYEIHYLSVCSDDNNYVKVK